MNTRKLSYCLLVEYYHIDFKDSGSKDCFVLFIFLPNVIVMGNLIEKVVVESHVPTSLCLHSEPVLHTSLKLVLSLRERKRHDYFRC
jgi:hypothetical protein